MTSKIKVSEKDFSSQVEDLLGIFKWHWCHFRPAQTKYGWRTALSGHKGFPDYIACRPPRLLIFELKDEKSQPTPEQQIWFTNLEHCRIQRDMGQLYEAKVVEELRDIPEVYLWRPSQIEEIAEILK